MKLATVTTCVSRAGGGLFSSVRELQFAVSRLPGIETKVFGINDKFTEIDLVQWGSLEIGTFARHGPKIFSYAPGLRKAILKFDPDIMHLHGLWTYSSVAVSAHHRRTHRPYIISPHGCFDPWALNNSWFKKQLARILYENRNWRQATCFRALCESEAKSMRALGLTAPICIIPNGINLPAESREEPPPWAGKIESNSKILLFLGRIHPKKGLANLLKAWRKVGGAGNAKANGWVLAIAGWSEGGHEAELKCLAAELEIPFADVTQSIRTAENSGIKAIGCSVSVPQVSLVFLGPQFFKAKKACLTSCDGFVLPSFGEGLPMSVLEAWSYGKPVLMTPDCNIPEGFEAQAALKVRADVDSIATGLREFFSLDDCGRQVLGDRGRLLVLGKFAWSNIAIQMKQVYDWMLGGGSLPGCFING